MQVGLKVPASDTVRKGDFGEMISAGIYSTRMGRTVPYGWNGDRKHEAAGLVEKCPEGLVVVFTAYKS